MRSFCVSLLQHSFYIKDFLIAIFKYFFFLFVVGDVLCIFIGINQYVITYSRKWFSYKKVLLVPFPYTDLQCRTSKLIYARILVWIFKFRVVIYYIIYNNNKICGLIPYLISHIKITFVILFIGNLL